MTGGQAPAEDHRGERDVRTVAVRFRVPGSLTILDCSDLDLGRGDPVIAETDRGPFAATVLVEPMSIRTSRELRRVLRRATEDDLQIIQRNRVREQEAFSFCDERIRALDQPMKLVAVEIAHSGTRAVFYFTSNERVDFRALVKNLARRFHTRIEMRQVGVRDAARHIGGAGICGRELCCATWLPEFRPISIRMAKDQNLALNHEKLSGVCGRLRCCLRYEQEVYQTARKGMPKLGKRVLTPQGEGRVRDLNILKQLVGVQFADGGIAEFGAGEVTRLTQVQGRREGDPRQAGDPPSEPTARTGDGDHRPGVDQDGGEPADRVALEPNTGGPTPASGSEGGDAAADGSSPKPRRRRRRRGRRGKPKPSDG